MRRFVFADKFGAAFTLAVAVGSPLSPSLAQGVEWAAPVALGAGSMDDELPAAGMKMAKGWIGVRISPLPAPLAAHIGEAGLMVANLIAGSPADQAGLRQYDVILVFNGQSLNGHEELLKAIDAVPAGKSAEIEIVRGGKRQKLMIAPIARPARIDAKYKYDEPDATVDNSVSYRGHSLRLDPNGNWVWQDLGPMASLPDDLLQHWPDFATFDWNMSNPPQLDLQSPMDHWMQYRVGLPQDARGSAQTEVRISVNSDGDMVSIHRRTDGSFEVDRTAPDGTKTTKQYASDKEFKLDDPNAYNLFAGDDAFFGGRIGIPNPAALPQLQRDYEAQIQQLIERAQQQARRMGAGSPRMDDLVEELRRNGGRDDDQTYSATSGNFSIQVSKEGGVAVIENQGSRQIKREFPSLNTLKEKEPALYEKIKGLLK